MTRGHNSIWWWILLGAALPLLGAWLMNAGLGRPEDLGVSHGRLSACPDSPNCVSTQATCSRHAVEPLKFAGDSSQAMDRLKGIMRAMPRSKVVTECPDYLHVEFTSRILRFVDDVEFYVVPQTQRIHFRSASRIGYSDLGVNRARMERIRRAFQRTDSAAPTGGQSGS